MIGKSKELKAFYTDPTILNRYLPRLFATIIRTDKGNYH